MFHGQEVRIFFLSVSVLNLKGKVFGLSIAIDKPVIDFHALWLIAVTLFWLISFLAMILPSKASVSRFSVSERSGCKVRGC